MAPTWAVPGLFFNFFPGLKLLAFDFSVSISNAKNSGQKKRASCMRIGAQTKKLPDKKAKKADKRANMRGTGFI